MKQPPTIEEQHQIAEEIVGTPITWEEDLKGYFVCPMSAGHTTPTREKHTLCYLDGVPTFFCWHQSCNEWIADASRLLRSKLDFRTAEEKAAAKVKSDERAQLKYDAMRLRRGLERIYEQYHWDLPRYSREESWNRFLKLWAPNEILWIGDVWDTGEKGIGHFRTVDEWRAVNVNFYANRFTTGSTFKPAKSDRIQANVLTTPYVIIEFDSLATDPEENKRRGAALLNYLRSAFDLKMMVDSGNKSVRGWFANDARMTDPAKFFLRQLGADMQTMRPSQPVRLPGAVRDNGTIQSVLYVPD